VLYFTERGRMISARNEEIWSWVQVRKTFSIEPVGEPGELYLFVCEYAGNQLPLTVTVGPTQLQIQPDPDLQGRFSWRTLQVPAEELEKEELVVTIGCPAPAMNAWILAIDPTGNCGASLKSTDRGAMWRPDAMGYDFVFSGEYLVRLWVPGTDLIHPDLPFQYEDPQHPRLGELRHLLEDSMGTLPSGTDFERAIALKDWLAGQWTHKSGWYGSAYAPWDAGVILDWARRDGGHGLKGLDAFCVHYAVAYVQFASALGLEARMVFSDTSSPGAEDGHCIPEVFCREHDKWGALDPDADVVPTLNGEPVGAMELHELAMSGESEKIEFVPGRHHASRSDFIRNFWHTLFPKVLFRRWGVLPRNDFFSHPDAFPCEHGRTAYQCTEILWYDSRSLSPYRWLPYHSSRKAAFLYHGATSAGVEL
jgi:hypothetical protein